MNGTLARLNRERQRYRITQERIAAACRPPVHRTMVNKVVNGKARSARVVAAAERLIAEAKSAHARGAA